MEPFPNQPKLIGRPRIPDEVVSEFESKVRAYEGRYPAGQRLETKRRMLTLLRDLSNHRHVPTGVELTLALQEAYGVSGRELVDWLNSARSLQAAVGSQYPLIRGSAGKVLRVLRSGMPDKLQSAITSSDSGMQIPELAKVAGTNPELTGYALNLLEARNVARRIRTKQGGKYAEVWLPATSAASPESVDSKVLRSLGGGSKTIADIAMETGISDGGIRNCLDRFEQTKFVARTGRRKMPRGGKQPRLFSLTENARQMGNAPAHEVRLMASLGSRRHFQSSRITPSLSRQLQRTVRKFRVIKAYDELPRGPKGQPAYGSIKGLRRRFNLSRGEMHSLLEPDRMPISSATHEELDAIHRPFLFRNAPDVLQPFNDFVRRHPDKFKQAPVDIGKSKRGFTTADEQSRLFVENRRFADNLATACALKNKKMLSMLNIGKDVLRDAAIEGLEDAVITYTPGHRQFRTHAFENVNKAMWQKMRFLSQEKRGAPTIPMDVSLEHGQLLQDLIPDKNARIPDSSRLFSSDLKARLQRTVLDLPISDRKKRVFIMLHGIDGLPPMTQGEVAGKVGVGPSRIQQIDAEVMGELRRPERLKELERYR